MIGLMFGTSLELQAGNEQRVGQAELAQLQINLGQEQLV